MVPLRQLNTALLRLVALVVALVAAGGTVAGTVARAQADVPLSPRNANYTIEVILDTEGKTLTARQTVTWRNLQETPTDELWFHLYWNAWRNNHSTWMRENRLSPRRNGRKNPRPEDWSYQLIEGMRLLSAEEDGEGVDLLASSRYAAPDDGNPEDRTVLVTTLPRAVAPGETVQVEMEWRAKVPRTFARTGYHGDFFFLAHWFPALGVYEATGWNCHQFHAKTEFFSDYGVYDVTMTVPATFVLGATGREVERTANGDGTVSHRYVQEDVHTFTWTTSPDYLVREQRFAKEGLPPVQMRLLIQPEHLAQAERHFRATEATLEHYGSWYGPYPYGQLTIVDPAYGSGVGGMEYPTLFTAGTRLWNPPGGGSPEGVTMHEAGHQFWYGVVGNNEFEHAWLDEGLNTFSTARVQDVVYGERTWTERYLSPPGLGRGFFPVTFDDIRLSRAVHGNRLDRFLRSGAATADAMAVPTFLYFPDTAGRLSYDKTAQWLMTLERHLGWETLRRILSTFYERHQFTHPTPSDFFAVANEQSGQDLSWFFDQVYHRSVTFDYAVDSVASFPARLEGLRESGGEMVLAGWDGEPLIRTEVAVRRHGGGVFPVDVLLVFEDGTEKRFPWDGRERWKLFVHEGPAALRHAVVDPERVLLLDLQYTNNSQVRRPEATLAVGKWGSRWMLWLQELLLGFTFFV